jgi:tetratricopeptide (TPR) repeat protein
MALATMVWLAAPGFAQEKPAQEKAAQERAGDKQAEKKKEWKDRAEYELYESIVKTKDPHQWLAAIQAWKQQYPESEYADVRRQLTLEAYRALNQPREAFAAAQDVLKDNPNDLVALSAMVGYIYSLVPVSASAPDPGQSQDLAAAEQAARTILDNIDVICSKNNRPANMTDQEAGDKKPALRAFAQKTLGYIALVRKDYPKAEAELTKALELDPRQGQVSFWLGEAVLAQNREHPEKQPQALYHFARAACYSGAGGLPARIHCWRRPARRRCRPPDSPSRARPRWSVKGSRRRKRRRGPIRCWRCGSAFIRSWPAITAQPILKTA